MPRSLEIPTTSFSRLSPWAARLTLAGAASLATFLVAVTLSPQASGFADKPDRGVSDVELYLAETQRIRAGESYYDAAAAELRARGYPTRSVFNWRTPLPMWLIGVAPDARLAQAVLVGIALAAAGLSLSMMERDGSLRSAYGAVALLIGALLPCILGVLFVMPVLWSGACIALSVTAYGSGRQRLGAAAGLTALFLRELAAPYCLLCLALAAWKRRWREAGFWLAGLAAYAVFFVWHAAQVAARTGPNEIAHDHGWICLGGAGFVISLVQMNAFLLVLPQWVSALYLALAIVGFAGWNSAVGQRVGFAVSGYLAAFAIVGQPFNQYWGCLIAPLLCFGVARAPAALRDLWVASRFAQRSGLPAGA